MNLYKERGEFLEYFSNYIWEAGDEGERNVSLVLQHAQVCKKSVLLACVCDSGNVGETGITESGYFSEGLVEWFHRSFLKVCEKKQTDDEVEKLLQKEVERLQGDAEKFVLKKGMSKQLYYWGILLWDNHFWIFAKGKCEGYLVNRRFQRKHMRQLGNETGAKYQDLETGETKINVYDEHRCLIQEKSHPYWLSGRLQHNLGILLCTSSFMSCIAPEEATEVLVVEGCPLEERLGKRLQELWTENKRRGETHSVGAIYIWT